MLFEDLLPTDDIHQLLPGFSQCTPGLQKFIIRKP